MDKFEGIETYEAVTGSPLLEDCLESHDCQVVNVLDDEGHKLIVAQVLSRDVHCPDADALIYRESDYA